MLFIIAGHLGIDAINRFVFTFHVPLFFLLSGYFYTYRPHTLKNKITRYLKPYIFTVISLVLLGELKSLILILLGKENAQSLLQTAFQWLIAGLYGSGSKTQFLAWNLPTIGAIWFLLALIWSITIMHILHKFKLSLWKQELIVIIFFVLGYISALYTWFPLSIQAGFSALLFVFLGHIQKLRQAPIYNDKKEAILLAIIFWIWSLYFSYTNNFMSLVRSCFPNILHNIIGACAASWIIIYVCRKLTNTVFSSFLITFGRYSAVVLCFHLIELTYIPWHIVSKLIPYGFITIPIIFIGKIIFCYFAILIVERNYILKKFFM